MTLDVGRQTAECRGLWAWEQSTNGPGTDRTCPQQTDRSCPQQTDRTCPQLPGSSKEPAGRCHSDLFLKICFVSFSLSHCSCCLSTLPLPCGFVRATSQKYIKAACLVTPGSRERLQRPPHSEDLSSAKDRKPQNRKLAVSVRSQNKTGSRVKSWIEEEPSLWHKSRPRGCQSCAPLQLRLRGGKPGTAEALTRSWRVGRYGAALAAPCSLGGTSLPETGKPSLGPGLSHWEGLSSASTSSKGQLSYVWWLLL